MEINSNYTTSISYWLMAGMLLFLTACTESRQDPLRMASSPWPGYEPLYLARDLGYLEEDKVQLFELPSSDITMESFRNRSTDLATLTLDETLELIHDGTRLRIVQVLDISNGGDAVLASPGIKSLAEIKGKRIAMVNIPLGLYMLNRLLDKAGLARSDVEVFPMSETKQEVFYKQGKADVVITFDPVKSKLQALGMKVIFDSSMIPNEIIDILVVHEDVYLQRRDEICDIAKQWAKTLAYMQSNKQDAAQRISKRLGVDVSEYDNIMGGILLSDTNRNISMLGGDNPEIIQSAKKLSAVMLKEKQLSKPVDITSSIDKSFVACFQS